MLPSIGSSKTMSAWVRPLCGLAAGSLPILTASAGRAGGVPPGAGAPVSGHVGAAGGTVVDVDGAVVVAGRVVAGALVGVDVAAFDGVAVRPTSATTTATAAATQNPPMPISKRPFEMPRRRAWAGRALVTRSS